MSPLNRHTAFLSIVLQYHIFVVSDPVQNLSDSTVNWSKAIHQVRSGYLPELKFTEERPYDKNDFAAHFNHSYKCLKDTLEIIRSQAILKPSLLKESKDILKNFTISAILLCGENVQSKEWNESRHIEIRYVLHFKRLYWL